MNENDFEKKLNQKIEEFRQWFLLVVGVASIWGIILNFISYYFMFHIINTIFLVLILIYGIISLRNLK